MERKPYPTDLTDEHWQLIEPLLPPAKPGGRPRKTDLREVLNALFYLNRVGCQWRMLPHEFPPWKTVYNYFRAWIDQAVWHEILATLRIEVRLLESSCYGRQSSLGIWCGSLGLLQACNRFAEGPGLLVGAHLESKRFDGRSG